MSENVRAASEIMGHLRDIYLYYEKMFGEHAADEAVEISKFVASNVSECSNRKWGWRYFLSLKNGTMDPSRFVSMAISKHAKQIRKKLQQNKGIASAKLTATRNRNAALKDYAIKKGYSSWSEIGTMILAGHDLVKEKEHAMNEETYKALYEEFGKEKVDKVRREMTAKNDRMPSYVELLAELYLRQGARR